MSPTATARDAGCQVVHTVRDWYGDVAGTRRSAHRYHYAICRRVSPRNPSTGVPELGRAQLVVVRWSRSSKCSGSQFAVPVMDAE